ncbi:MAG: cation diffusion facilitator family transporter [Candidatus Methylomirabilales bacterium]
MSGSHRERAAKIRTILVATLILNWSVAALKIGYGVWSQTLSMVADGFHSVLDGSGNIVGLIAMSFAMQPADPSHPYGHRKFESFAALGISFLLLLAAYEIGQGVFHRWQVGTTPQVTSVSFVVMVVAMAVNLFVSWYENRAGQQLQSDILVADAMHTRSDLFASLGVLASLAAAKAGYPGLDVVAALFIILLIGRSGIRMIGQSLYVLSDASRLPAGTVEKAALQVTGVREVHAVRSRGFADAIYMDLHILVDPQLTVAAAHAIAHRVEASLKKQFPQVADMVVHVEPDIAQERRRSKEDHQKELHLEDRL